LRARGNQEQSDAANPGGLDGLRRLRRLPSAWGGCAATICRPAPAINVVAGLDPAIQQAFDMALDSQVKPANDRRNRMSASGLESRIKGTPYLIQCRT
ncbi:MAG: hypothetical protein V3S95_01185, partial [Alphaproteobacteria bacterium]